MTKSSGSCGSDPYYNTIAEKYPSVKPVVARAISQMKARKLALVHGDYSPKNIFVLREKMDSRTDPYLEHDSSGYESGKEKMDSRFRGNDGVGAPSVGCGSESKASCANPILLLDFEVVHWGDPAFDLAFCVNHLLIKSIVNAHVQTAYFQAVSAMLEGYRNELPAIDWAELLAETTAPAWLSYAGAHRWQVTRGVHYGRTDQRNRAARESFYPARTIFRN